MGKPVTITLTVEAYKLYNDQLTVLNACTLSDDNAGSSPDGTCGNFTSNVYLNNNVKWVGKTKDNTTDQGYDVAITSVVYIADPTDVDFFDLATLPGSGGRKGNVNGNVKNDRELVGQHDSYKINFDIYPPANSSLPKKSYPIDPKLQGNN
jgi:hypothetical protein